MRSFSQGLSDHLAQEVTTLATCWKVTRRDGVVLGFTDHDVTLTLQNVPYKAQTGMTPTAVSSSLGLAVDNLDVEGLLSDASITQEDILAGKYDDAAIEVFLVNYKDLAAGKIQLTSGWLGQVTLKGQQFVAELRGLSEKLQQTIGEVYTPTCRANLGDSRCKKNLAAYTVTGTITAVTGLERFRDAARSEIAGYFSYGTVTFTSGANAGFKTEVREFINGDFSLFMPVPKPLMVGDTYQAIAGCDKRLDTCIGRFQNAVNFRGEPHVPGTDKILETSATRSID
jgi:uncharacterized phage protein (TIGR02218 family)